MSESKKLWDKGVKLDQTVQRFTVGRDRELDLAIARFDVQASIAHVRMLESAEILNSEEARSLLEALADLRTEIADGEFSIGEEFEDVHSKIEAELVRRCGDAGKRVHTARSRNDQVLVALHLYVREQTDRLAERLEELFNLLMDRAENHAEDILPGYTHMQIAMPSSWGLWFSGWAEMLIDDLVMLQSARSIADQNPLGSAAGYGSSFPIDRDMTTRELDFADLRYSSYGCALSRGRLEWSAATAVAAIAGTISRLSTDVVLYSGANFGFVRLPEEIVTGSSIMPHKQNPDVFELLRARCNLLRSLPTQIDLLMANLPGGYHRDFQLLKELLVPAFTDIDEVLGLVTAMIDRIQINDDWQKDPRYAGMYSVERIHELVRQGVPFRDAYHQVAREYRQGDLETQQKLEHHHLGSLGNLGLDRIRQKWSSRRDR